MLTSVGFGIFFSEYNPSFLTVLHTITYSNVLRSVYNSPFLSLGFKSHATATVAGIVIASRLSKRLLLLASNVSLRVVKLAGLQLYRGGRGELTPKKRDFTAVSRVLFPLGQRAASLFVELIVEQSEGGEILGGDNRPRQAEYRERYHNNGPVCRGHVGLHV